MNDEARTFSLTPIGVIHSPFHERADAPRQPRAAPEVEGRVELFGGRGYEDALSDLACWDHIWLVVWFDRNRGFSTKVTPPRSDRKRGVFATRAPYRPNPIGISAVRLVSVDGLMLTVSGLDLLDGTPLLDIKPYVPYTDSIAGANHGWLEQAVLDDVQPRDPGARYEVGFDLPAEAQLAYLRDAHAIELAPRIEAQLALGPEPHAYRRIRREGDKFRLAVKDWRAWFRVEGQRVTVERIGSGYRARDLADAPAAHRDFCARFG
jgi:tRNA-Thr(GGU) m(6)t(6)A37 methyltransferase TsaA